MSVRGKTKRASGARVDEAGASKRRRTEPEDSLWQLRPVSDLKMSSIYNRSASEAPAELFRKDLISAMKLPDSEQLTSSEYWVITDTWKQDWERGVQVPVNPDSLPEPKVKIIENPLPPGFQEFKLPKDKYIHLESDLNFKPDQHQLSTTVANPETACNYDLDALDAAWLNLLNAERARAGAPSVTDDQFEKVIEELEVRCCDKVQAIVKSEEGLGIEYDENVICDVCRSPDSEDGNEMVFCDSCNICVHQACYGITVIPSGQWLCRPCGDGVRPSCVLCPNHGGAMKCTPSGHKWAHVSCVLWIPEVSIGCAEKMEPITKISAIPSSRWSLMCVLCRERKGACIQCSVKTCKTAYHVTCAFKHGLEMRAIIEDENADDGVKLRSYCQKHSVNTKKEKSAGSGSEEEEVKKKRRKDMTTEEKTQARAARLQEIEREFDRHVSVKDISAQLLDVDRDAIFYIYNYWKIKRRAYHNRPLLPPKADDSDILAHRQEQADLDKMKMFVQLRQDLERVRNLCYMVSRREKLSRSFFRMREQTFHKQLSVLTSDRLISPPELAAIIEANHGPSIYDRLYSHPDAPDHQSNFNHLLARIAGSESSDEKKDTNGVPKISTSNPYKKVYMNGSTKRTGSIYSGLSSEESTSEMSRPTSKKLNQSIVSTDEGKSNYSKKKTSPSTKKSVKTSHKTRKAKSKLLIDSSSDDDDKPLPKPDMTRSKTLHQMEKEMTEVRGNHSGSESDEIRSIRPTQKTKFLVDIYSDSSDNDVFKSESKTSDKSSNTTSDSLQPLPRTKAAMKEFIPSQINEKINIEKRKGRKLSTSKEKKSMSSGEVEKIKEDKKHSRPKENTTNLIVPQRQAAKKAFENMRSTTCMNKSKDEQSLDKQNSGDDIKPKNISKTKKDPKSVLDRSLKADHQTTYKDEKKVSQEMGKDTIAYVPQRQAAKKAAAHIKSGLGSKTGAIELNDDKKKDSEIPEISKRSPSKEGTSVKKCSSSSSSNSSSSSYSSSSSSELEDLKAQDIKAIPKTRDDKSEPRKSPAGSRPTVDLPFLDRVSRPLSSTSASSDSCSSQNSRGSGSGSSVPKRLRRRRKRKTTNSTTTLPKAPDKKFKTSELGSVPGVSSPPVEGEKSSGFLDESSSTCPRTGSTFTSRNLSDKLDTRERKSSADKNIYSFESNQVSKEECKPSELSPTEWKENQAINVIKRDTSRLPSDVRCNEKNKITVDNSYSASQYEDAKEHFVKSTQSPSMVCDNYQRDVKIKEHSSLHSYDMNKNSSYTNTMTPKNIIEHELPDRDRQWYSKAMSPFVQPPAIEKLGDHEKYMTESKSLNLTDIDHTERTSLKMIAKIQANLNENTMIKSPKTPMDARISMEESIDIGNRDLRDRKKLSLESGKGFNTLDSSHVQGVEISKSAKVPSAIHQLPNRSIFSPQSKENELYDIDMMAVDDSFGHDDIMKPFPSYADPFFFKEDSKEEGVQETLNLVDRLRMQLSSKKVTSDYYCENSLIEDNNLTSEGKSSPLSKMQYSSNAKLNLPSNSPLKSTNLTDLTSASVQAEASARDLVPPISSTSTTPGALNLTDKSSSNIYSERDTRESTSLMHRIHNIYNIEQNNDSQIVRDSSINALQSEKSNTLHDNNDVGMSTFESSCSNQDSNMQESEIANRRSSTSSSNSNESSYSHRTEENSQVPITQSKIMTKTEKFSALPEYSIAPTVSLNPYDNYRPHETPSPFLSTMSSISLLDSGSCGPVSSVHQTSEMNLFSQNLSDNKQPNLSMNKSSFSTMCSAAFTLSSQNIALTTSMIAPPTPRSIESPQDTMSIHIPSSPSIDSSNETTTRSHSKISNDNSLDSSVSTHCTKSPPRLKPLNKLISHHGKSPKRSPNFSPKQSESHKSGITKRSKNKTQKSKTKTKSRNQAHGFLPHPDYASNSIQSKLVGTVYDFNDEVADNDINIKSLRERRKSVDINERKIETSIRSNPSPQQKSPDTVKVIDSEKPREITNTEQTHETPVVKKATSEMTHFTPIVQPVLPGPVNMRTYQPIEGTGPVVTGGEVYRNQLLAFASGAADQHLAEIDEEAEKQLHTALMSNPLTTKVAEVCTNEIPQLAVPQLPKVSLSDSRNQLKVKIKGPFLDANYSASSSQPVVPQPIAPVDTGTIANVSNTINPSVVSGTTSLRRMRKKELLRQYWTQDMNMDDPSSSHTPGLVTTPALANPFNRAVITIPKAVASMTSIPTREDYKGLTDYSTIDKKKRKTSGLARELRHLEVSMNDDDVSTPYNPTHAKRGKASNKPKLRSPVTPKLKIKIGSGIVQPLPSSEVTNDYHFRPPKKRIVNLQKPNIEDLRRESMKYRRMVMADFEENEKVKKHKPNKSEKRKKKKDKKSEKLRVINSESESSTKLIIKIKRPKEDAAKAITKEGGASAVGVSQASASEPAVVDPFEYDPSAPDPLAIDPPSYAESTSALRKIRTAKVTPIRLKLAKSAKGSSYIMKGVGAGDAPAATDTRPPEQSLPMSVSKHCDVR